MKYLMPFAIFAMMFIFCGFGPAFRAPSGVFTSGDAIPTLVPSKAKSRCDTVAGGGFLNISTGTSIGISAAAVDNLTTLNPISYTRSIDGNGVFFPIVGGVETLVTDANTSYVRFSNPGTSSFILCTERSN